MIATVFIAVLIISGLCYVLVRLSQRLLQFDSLFQDVMSILDSYSTDLVRMTSADIDSVLTDHPEVISFHMRNTRASLEIKRALGEISKITPPRRKAPALPKPDVE